MCRVSHSTFTLPRPQLITSVHSILEALLFFLNKRKEKERVANGKPARLEDLSMRAQYSAREDHQAEPGEDGVTEGPRLGENAFADLTDRQNDEFVYTY